MRNKYNAKRTVVDGITFHSGVEANRYAELKLLERAGEISELMLQQSFVIDVSGVHICTYIADFSYIEKGRNIVEDKKGVRTALYSIKTKLVLACHGVDIRET